MKKILSSLFMLICLTNLLGCSLNVAKESFSSGKILVMPTRDVVQGGKAHAVGSNSGAYFQKMLVSNLSRYRSFTAVAYEADSTFTHTSPIDSKAALAVASKQGTDYCLTSNLGEFRDAAPMTFRNDFATLQNAELREVKSGRVVWSLQEPFSTSGTNVGSYYPLLEDLAEKVASSIARR